MSMLKSLYNLLYKSTNKAQNEPKNVFSDVEVEVEKDIAVDETGICKIDLWTPKDRSEKLRCSSIRMAEAMCPAANTMCADSQSGLLKWASPS